ncbi:MAG: SOS response-associated peptidase [Actinomycetaceae bacterium]|nr:SOS response-associated peptidase [Actinomycetaceae bacterium]
MCGRYGIWASQRELVTLFDIALTIGDNHPTWNAAPSQELPVVLERADQGRRLQHLTWGLVPHWAHDAKRPMINARSETLTEKPSFKEAARRRRCLIPANGYYEWQEEDGSKQPWFLSAGDDDPVMGFAGIYDAWRDPEATENDQWRRSFAIITRSAPDALGHIHDRSPVVVPPDMWSDWLDPVATTDSHVAHLLDMIPPPRLSPRKVGRAVGNIRNNDSSLTESVE